MATNENVSNETSRTTHDVLDVLGTPISMLAISMTSQSSGETPSLFKKTALMVLVIFPLAERPASSTEVFQISSAEIKGYTSERKA